VVRGRGKGDRGKEDPLSWKIHRRHFVRKRCIRCRNCLRRGKKKDFQSSRRGKGNQFPITLSGGKKSQRSGKKTVPAISLNHRGGRWLKMG